MTERGALHAVAPFFFSLPHTVPLDAQCCCPEFGHLSCLLSSLCILFILPSFLPKTERKGNISDGTIPLPPLPLRWLIITPPPSGWTRLSLTHFLTLTPILPAPTHLQNARSLHALTPLLCRPFCHQPRSLSSCSPSLFLPQSCSTECSQPCRLSL